MSFVCENTKPRHFMATGAGLETFVSALRPTELTVLVTWHWVVAISLFL